jgi:hypothetical protein
MAIQLGLAETVNRLWACVMTSSDASATAASTRATRTNGGPAIGAAPDSDA